MENPAFPDAVDTNEEYIIPENAKKEPAVFGTVVKAIIVDTASDFFGSILGFFLKYIRHFFTCFRYFWSPTLKKHPFDKHDYKQHCTRSFELVMLVLVALIFLLKLDLIPPTSKALLDVYNNDVTQMVMQFMIFVVFAVTYLVLILFSILAGRLFRNMFRIPITRRESDILCIYLTNALFSIASLVSFWARCSTSAAAGDTQQAGLVVLSLFLVFCLPIFLLWAIRFSTLNGLKRGKGILFTLTAVVVYTLFFSVADTLVTSFLLGV
jgi:hypothetical protein